MDATRESPLDRDVDVSATTASGTIAVLNRGEIIVELDDWLGMMRERYPGQVFVTKPRGNQIARGRNLAVDRSRGHWLLFVDSDVLPPLDAVERLLAHDAAIVGSVVYERYPIRVDGRVRFPVAASLDGRKLFDEDVKVSNGLMRVSTVGMACTLIRREVFMRLEMPYFRCGQIELDMLTEDTEFCLRAFAAAKVETYLDCEVRAGHRADAILWPGRDGQRWVEWIGAQDCREPEPKT